jgi:N-acetylglucosamine-6-sulfatase
MKQKIIIAIISVISFIGTVHANSPDILFILLDDLRWDALSYKNHPYVSTPHIDQLRSQGVSLENAFCATSICCPSRATFLTGTYASTHGVIDNETSEYNPSITPPFTKQLQEANYTTAMIGKWHMGHSAQPRPFFDHWISFKGQGKYNDETFNINGQNVPQQGYTTDLLTAETIRFIEHQPKNKPWFCMLSHKAVHEPFMPHPRHITAFGADQTDIEPTSWSSDFTGKPDWHRRQRSRDVRWFYRTKEYEEEQLPMSVPAQTWNPHQKKYIEQFRCLASVDDGIGKIIRALEKRGTLHNTLIIFTSDNGYFHGEHRRWDKRLAMEESIRIPMVISYPGHIKKGDTVTQLVSNIDMAPTILDYAGIHMPNQMQGKSMRNLFEGDKSDWRKSIFYEYWVDLVHSIPTMTAVRTDRYKLVQYPEINDLDELYDLKTDPNELTNLATSSQHSKLHHQMKQLLNQEKKEIGWRADVFPKNLPRYRGTQSLDSQLLKSTTHFKGTQNDLIKIPYNEDADPSSWPWEITLEVNPETDGVIASQASPSYGVTLFIQDNRPGIAIRCKTWIDSVTILDAPVVNMREWTTLQAVIDYNRVSFKVDGKLIESRPLPQPFKVRTKQPLFIGGTGPHSISSDLPNQPFRGQLRHVTVKRPSIE